MTQAPTPGPLSGDDELIERGLRSIRTYNAVRSLRDALTATTARLTGYDWNADPDAITKQQGDAFAAADRVFSDLDAAVAAHPDIDLAECNACNGTGKIEEPAWTEGANQHSACVRSCDECDGCGFAPDESLAPTAPVEASGSGREQVEHLARTLDKSPDEIRRALANLEAKGLIALRPQPSGETREAAWTYCPECGSDEIGHEEGDHKQCGHCGQEWFSDIDYSGVVQKNLTRLALLSARPLALGGQQGEATWHPLDDEGLAEVRVNGKRITSMPSYDGAKDVAQRINEALSTTPARAEAQDEGAAGEPVAWWYRPKHMDGPWSWTDDIHAAKGYLADGEWDVRLEYAHPSPTPAADAERVGEAIADVISHESDWRTALTAMDAAEETPEDGSGKPGYWLHQIKVLDRILAALKSEGK